MKFINTHLQGNLKELAEYLGISKGHLSNILAGRRSPSAKIAQRLYFKTLIPMETWLKLNNGKNPFIEKLRRENKRKEKKK